MNPKLIPLPLLLLVAGCAAVPPTELRDARAEYVRASNGLAAELDPGELHVAQQQLAIADAAFRKEGDSQATRDLAYTALRRIQLAEVKAQTSAAIGQSNEAQHQIQQLTDEQVRLTSARLGATERALEVSERQRAEAERSAELAAAALIHIATVKQLQDTMVISMPSEVLFASGKSDLLPQAQDRLDQVLAVLAEQGRDTKIVVQGYTDATGSDASNVDLSRRRADSVRAYLVGHGIDPERITAEGYGSANPVADNATPENRAGNRRVEIVVRKKAP
jgi:outer membrane protein OmpA-like peptidoglycan-associated protein